MNQFTSSILVLLVVLSFHGVTADVVNDVCRKASGSNPSVTYGFCSKSFEANPKSRSSNIYGIGEISMELALRKAASVTSLINTILNGGGKVSPDVRGALVSCQNNYKTVVRSVQGAISAYKGRDLAGANQQIYNAMDAGQSCKDEFQAGMVSPTEKDVQDFVLLTYISYTIIGMNA
ncbi:putative invertase inhibitor [Papaver somniferum]|uniref:putative invertase inhibitor n=1 Tax=Papaver somniferum TaxID=3469 RepID=UPI000E6FF94C|nr:putative invertase inhibitor [Papaver somniferum]